MPTQPLPSLRDNALAAFPAPSIEAALQGAGEIFIAHLKAQGIEAHTDILNFKDRYPLLKIIAADGQSAWDALRALEMPLPGMPGLHFSDIVFFVETDEDLTVILNAGPQIVQDYAGVLKGRSRNAPAMPEHAAAGPA